jgi:hypothetical protein
MSNSITVAEPPTNPQTPTDENPFTAQVAEEARKPKPLKPDLRASIITGKKVRPIFCLIGGQGGIGKTTFGSQAPDPIFLDTERSADQVGAHRFPTPSTYLEFALQLDFLDKEEHPYKSIVVDTVDALEPLINQRTCEDLRVSSIDQPEKGGGYIHAKGLWRKLLTKMRAMSERFNIILIGHLSVKPFNDPASPTPYDCWRLRINEKCADVLKESVDIMLYACIDLTVTKASIKDKKGRAIGTDHIMHTRPAPGYDAKNRFDLEDPLPLEWQALEDGVRAFYAQ